MFKNSKPSKEEKGWMGFKSKDKTGKIGDLQHQGTTEMMGYSAMPSAYVMDASAQL